MTQTSTCAISKCIISTLSILTCRTETLVVFLVPTIPLQLQNTTGFMPVCQAHPMTRQFFCCGTCFPSRASEPTRVATYRLAQVQNAYCCWIPLVIKKKYSTTSRMFREMKFNIMHFSSAHYLFKLFRLFPSDH